ncbi:MAG: glycosyltransferase family 2 protein [Candidatus Omnitrophota bacterium]
MPIPVSVVIIAKNEERRIKECLESVHGWADDIIIVDDNSTDATREISLKYTDKFFTRTWDLEGRQRNFGDSKSKNDWILLLDCDERVTEELRKDISDIIANPLEKKVAFWAMQTTYLGDVALLNGGWSTPHIRLYNKKHAQWIEAEADILHPGLKIEQGFGGGNISSRTIHYSYRNLEDLIAKVNRYSTYDALKWHLSGKKMTLGIGIWRTVDRFFRRFIGKKGCKDGYYGFAAAVISAFQEIASYSKYKEVKEKGYYLDYIKKAKV